MAVLGLRCCARAFSSCGEWGYSSLQCAGFSLRWLLLLQSMGSRHVGFSSCGTQAQQLWRMGLVAPQHVGSSRTGAWTRIPCTGRWILNHCATREVPTLQFNSVLTYLCWDSIRSHRLRGHSYETALPTSDASPKSRLSPVLLTYLL